MKLSEAIKALEQGHKIKHRAWLDDTFIYLKNGLLLTQTDKVYVCPFAKMFFSGEDAYEIYEAKFRFKDVAIGDRCRFSDNSGWIWKVQEFETFGCKYNAFGCSKKCINNSYATFVCDETTVLPKEEGDL